MDISCNAKQPPQVSGTIDHPYFTDEPTETQ